MSEPATHASAAATNAAVSILTSALTQAAQTLTKANTRTELLAEFTEKKRLMGLSAKTLFEPVAHAPIVV